MFGALRNLLELRCCCVWNDFGIPNSFRNVLKSLYNIHVHCVINTRASQPRAASQQHKIYHSHEFGTKIPQN